MSLYTIALFVHISGVIGYFISSGTWLLGLSILRRARNVEQVRTVASLAAQAGPVSGVSLLFLLMSGLYMAVSAWGFTPGWIIVALVSLVLIAPSSAALIEPRRRAIARLAQETPDGPIPEALERLTHNPVLRIAVQTLAILLLGIVFLMSTKPDLVGSLIVVTVALVVGLGSSLLLLALPRKPLVAVPVNQSNV
jgi:hypothetical protein